MDKLQIKHLKNLLHDFHMSLGDARNTRSTLTIYHKGKGFIEVK